MSNESIVSIRDWRQLYIQDNKGTLSYMHNVKHAVPDNTLIILNVCHILIEILLDVHLEKIYHINHNSYLHVSSTCRSCSTCWRHIMHSPDSLVLAVATVERLPPPTDVLAVT